MICRRQCVCEGSACIANTAQHVFFYSSQCAHLDRGCYPAASLQCTRGFPGQRAHVDEVEERSGPKRTPSRQTTAVCLDNTPPVMLATPRVCHMVSGLVYGPLWHDFGLLRAPKGQAEVFRGSLLLLLVCREFSLPIVLLPRCLRIVIDEYRNIELQPPGEPTLNRKSQTQE